MASLQYFIGNCWIDEYDYDIYEGSWVPDMNHLSRVVITSHPDPENDLSFMERSGSWYVDYDEAIKLTVKRRI